MEGSDDDGRDDDGRGSRAWQFAKPHPEVLAICVAGELSARLMVADDTFIASCSAEIHAFDERSMLQPLRRVDKLSASDADVLSFVRSLLLHDLGFSSEKLIVTHVIVERMVESGLPLHVHTLRPMLIAAGILVSKLCSDQQRRPLARFSEPLPLLEALEGRCLRAIGWRIPIDESHYAAASSKLLARLDTYLLALRSRSQSPTSTMEFA